MAATRPATGSHDRALGTESFTGRVTGNLETKELEKEIHRLRDKVTALMDERNAAIAEADDARRIGAERADRLREAAARLEAENDRLRRHLIALRRHVGEAVSRQVAGIVERARS